jgi:membrane protein implicated in regulation of membrane protease activity
VSDERAFAVVLMLIPIAASFLFGGVLLGVICLVLAAMISIALWTPVRGWLGIPAPKQGQDGGGRIGYIGRKGSRGDLSKAKIEGQDTAIDNEGDVDASEADIK